MIITISGLPGAGKTTASTQLAHKLNCPRHNASGIIRTLAQEHGMSVADFMETLEKNPSVHHEIDAKTIEMAQEAQKTGATIILEGRLAGHLMAQQSIPAFKVWIGASPETRWRRISGREQEKVDNTAEETQKREQLELEQYKTLYGIDLLDTSVYDSVILNDTKSPEETLQELMNDLAIWQTKHKTQQEPTKQ